MPTTGTVPMVLKLTANIPLEEATQFAHWART